MLPSTSSEPDPFPVRRLSEIESQPPERLWLVEDLWLRGGVGVLGGAPKTCKTFLAAEIAFSVAAGAPVLGRYATRQPGPVLFFGAEDSLQALRGRFEGIARARDIAIDDVPLLLLDVSALRLDRPGHIRRLDATIRIHKPCLIVLDPFVRIVAIDENSSAEVSAVLGALRTLQREHETAVLLVHHARKASGSSPTQAFRGSGDIGAWGDTNLVIARRKEGLLLSLEHRNAAAPDPLLLRLLTDPAPHLALVSRKSGERGSADAPETLDEQLLALLPHTGVPRPASDLREVVARRKSDVLAALKRLETVGKVERGKSGWRRKSRPVAPMDGGQQARFPGFVP